MGSIDQGSDQFLPSLLGGTFSTTISQWSGVVQHTHTHTHEFSDLESRTQVSHPCAHGKEKKTVADGVGRKANDNALTKP